MTSEYWLGADCLVRVLLCVCSVVENMPPVVLTDEEICLEVVERSDSAR